MQEIWRLVVTWIIILWLFCSKIFCLQLICMEFYEWEIQLNWVRFPVKLSEKSMPNQSSPDLGCQITGNCSETSEQLAWLSRPCVLCSVFMCSCKCDAWQNISPHNSQARCLLFTQETLCITLYYSVWMLNIGAAVPVSTSRGYRNTENLWKEF